MNKKIMKIGALALGMVTSITLFANAQDTGVVSLSITAGDSICSYGKDLTFDATGVKMDQAYTFQSNFNAYTGEYSGTNTWSCIDLDASNASGWAFDVLSDDLVHTVQASEIITADNVAIQYGAATIEGDTDCESNGTATWNPLNTNVKMMERDYSTKGVCKVTVPNVELKVEVEANKAPGTYNGDFTVTIPNFEG